MNAVRQAHPPARDFFLRQKDAVQQRIGVILEQRGREFAKIHDAFLGDVEFSLQPLKKRLVFAFKNVGAVQPMGFEHGVRERLSATVHFHERETFERSHPIIGDGIPADSFEAIRHALRRLHQEHLFFIRTVVGSCSEVGKAGGLEARALKRFESGFEQQARRGF